MMFLGSVGGQLIISVFCGLLIAVTPLGIRELALVVGLGCLAIGWRQRFKLGSRVKLGTAVLAGLALSVICGICLVAHFAPLKTKGKVLAEHIELAKTNYTLVELQESVEFDRPGIPIRSSFSVDKAEATRTIRFPRRVLTIREFIDAIERQSSLRHKFHSCGNGHTILTGEDCCFGLSFSTNRQMPGAVVKVE
jgi:hypothetical protein